MATWEKEVTEKLKDLYRQYKDHFHHSPTSYEEINYNNVTTEQLESFIEMALKHNVEIPTLLRNVRDGKYKGND